uniref:Uncharacterized protein n=1 Tax=Caenorhabditis japonica TaxID=281687 RepID=A0A8R1EB36_CAEJA
MSHVNAILADSNSGRALPTILTYTSIAADTNSCKYCSLPYYTLRKPPLPSSPSVPNSFACAGQTVRVTWNPDREWRWKIDFHFGVHQNNHFDQDPVAIHRPPISHFYPFGGP